VAFYGSLKAPVLKAFNTAWLLLAEGSFTGFLRFSNEIIPNKYFQKNVYYS